MPITAVERLESRTVDNTSAELRFYITGTTDDDAARTALLAASASTHNGLPRTNVRVEDIGPEKFDGTVLYGSRQSAGPETGTSVYSFDTGGGTQHITQSKETINSYSASGSGAVDFEGAIGVSDAGVEGVDIVVPVYNFAETHYIDDATVNDAYKLALANLTGKVNNATFRGFAAGEVLFLGASGSKRLSPSGVEDWEITFRFSRSPNVTGLTIGTITGISKKGWEYLWVRYADTSDGTGYAMVKAPIHVYIERTYDNGDYTTLGI